MYDGSMCLQSHGSYKQNGGSGISDCHFTYIIQG